MREICERQHALPRFLRNRRDDFRSRAELNFFMRIGTSNDFMEVELSATEEEIALRFIFQSRRALSLLRRGRRFLTPPWLHYAEHHVADLATLAKMV